MKFKSADFSYYKMKDRHMKKSKNAWFIPVQKTEHKLYKADWGHFSTAVDSRCLSETTFEQPNACFNISFSKVKRISESNQMGYLPSLF